MTRLFVVLLALGLTACETYGTRESPGAPPSYPRPPSQSEPVPGMPSPAPQQQPQQPQIATYARTPEELGTGPAVMQLLKDADTQRTGGHADEAQAVLERALHIEPRNPFVWQAIARTQIDQGLADQAETAAQKSNSLAHGNPYIEADNWRLIAAAREMRGDEAGALQARSQADEIERSAP